MKKICLLFVCTILLILPIYSQLKSFSKIDSAVTKSLSQANDKPAFIKTCFYIADEFMNYEQYDSAQLWLNKIQLELPFKSISIDNYYLITRQAEVYYYNNLQQLGLQESRRGLEMAQALNDSMLLADSYNFLGLFYMNIDSIEFSVDYYKKGLLSISNANNATQHISLSKPHHLHGNLAEAYYKLQAYDSALYHNYKSLQKAVEYNSKRGTAVAYAGLGDVYAATGQQDSALKNYIKGASLSSLSNDIDVSLICRGGMAKCNFELGNIDQVDKNLQVGFSMLKEHTNINRFYALLFLNVAIDIYKKRNNLTELIKSLELKSFIEKANIDGNNKQIQTILNAGMENEKRILSMQVADAERKQVLANTRLGLTLAVLAFVAVGFLIYRYYLNQKLAISKIKQKISQDLHDDIGASMSSLHIYGVIAEQSLQDNPSKTLEMVNKMNEQSKEIMENLNDIVWSMKTSNSNTSIEIKIKNYAASLLVDSDTEFKCNVMSDAANLITSITARKNLLLIAKEAINNIAKYSKAKNAKLTLQLFQKKIELIIEDDGIGFNEAYINRGNGLDNMEQRTLELKGNFSIHTSSGNGTIIKFVFPISSVT